MITLSIVTTLYRSSPHIEEFHRRMVDCLQRITSSYEIIMVNDGSPDDSLAVALETRRRDPHVKVLDLSRNFGHHIAMMAGLEHARGDHVFLIDSDLEEQPEWLETFWKACADHPDTDVVFGVQNQRKGGALERITGEIFYRLFNLFSDFPIPQNLVTTRIMSRRYVDALLAFPEREVFIPGLWACAGFRQEPLVVEKLSCSETSYTLRKKIKHVLNAITAFSSKPLYYLFLLGFAIVVFSALYGSFLIYQGLSGVDVQGWPSLMCSIWFLGGIQIGSIGVIGIYLVKIFNEVKQRPRSIVRRFYQEDNPVV